MSSRCHPNALVCGVTSNRGQMGLGKLAGSRPRAKEGLVPMVLMDFLATSTPRCSPRRTVGLSATQCCGRNLGRTETSHEADARRCRNSPLGRPAQVGNPGQGFRKSMSSSTGAPTVFSSHTGPRNVYRQSSYTYYTISSTRIL